MPGGWTRWLPPCGSGSTTRRHPAASGGSGLALAVRRRGDGRGDPDLAPRRTAPRRRELMDTSWCGWRSRRMLSRMRLVAAAGRRSVRPGARRSAGRQGVHRGTARRVRPRSAVRGRLGAGRAVDAAAPRPHRCRWMGPACGSRRSGQAGARFAPPSTARPSQSTFTDERWHAMAAGLAYADARCLVAYDDQGVAVAAVTVWSAGPDKPGLLEPMGVHPEHRGHGYGTAITVAAAAALQELGSSSATRLHAELQCGRRRDVQVGGLPAARATAGSSPRRHAS